jgi:hypothetical protein
MICPICKLNAEDISGRGFDGIAVRCKLHGDFEVSDTALALLENAEADVWEDALAIAKHFAKPEARPQITSDCF